MSYSRRTTEWTLTNLLELRQGIWPDPEPGEYIPQGKHSKGYHAPFESPAGMAGFVELKLKSCGLDGLMTKIYFVMNESEVDLAKIARCPVRWIPGRINNVLNFISGKPKCFEDGRLKTYRQYTGHGK